MRRFAYVIFKTGTIRRQRTEPGNRHVYTIIMTIISVTNNRNRPKILSRFMCVNKIAVSCHCHSAKFLLTPNFNTKDEHSIRREKHQTAPTFVNVFRTKLLQINSTSSFSRRVPYRTRVSIVCTCSVVFHLLPCSELELSEREDIHEYAWQSIKKKSRLIWRNNEWLRISLLSNEKCRRKIW